MYNNKFLMKQRLICIETGKYDLTGFFPDLHRDNVEISRCIKADVKLQNNNIIRALSYNIFIY